jgi:hypothetical protein
MPKWKTRPLVPCSIGFIVIAGVLLAVAGLSKTRPLPVAVQFLSITNIPRGERTVLFQIKNDSKYVVQSAACMFEFEGNPSERGPSIQELKVRSREIQSLKVRMPHNVSVPCRATFYFHVLETSFDFKRERLDRFLKKMDIRVRGLNPDNDNGRYFQVTAEVSNNAISRLKSEN